MEINKINSLINLTDYGDKKTTSNKDKDSFGDFLTSALNQVNQTQLESEKYKELLAIGELDNLYDLTIAAEKADTAMQLTLSIRNKIVEAYKEILRIQI